MNLWSWVSCSRCNTRNSVIYWHRNFSWGCYPASCQTRTLAVIRNRWAGVAGASLQKLTLRSKADRSRLAFPKLRSGAVRASEKGSGRLLRFH